MPPEGRATKARSTPPEAGPEGATRPRALRWLVRGLVLLGALVVVLALALWALLENLNHPAVKQRLLALVKDQAGLEVDYTGLEVSLLDGVRAEELRVLSPPRFAEQADTFVRVRGLHADAALWRFAFGGRRLQGVDLERVEVTVVRDASGASSLSELFPKREEEEPESPRPLSESLEGLPELHIDRLGVGAIAGRLIALEAGAERRVTTLEGLGLSGAVQAGDTGLEGTTLTLRGAPLTLEHEAPGQRSQARLPLEVSLRGADAQTVALTAQLGLEEQSFVRGFELPRQLVDIAASARFDPAADKTTFDLARVAALDGALGIEGKSEVQDGEPVRSLTSGKAALALDALPPGLPLALEQLMLELEARELSWDGARLSGFVSTRGRLGRVELDSPQGRLRAGAAALRGEGRLDGPVGKLEGELTLASVETESEQGDAELGPLRVRVDATASERASVQDIALEATLGVESLRARGAAAQSVRLDDVTLGLRANGSAEAFARGAPSTAVVELAVASIAAHAESLRATLERAALTAQLDGVEADESAPFGLRGEARIGATLPAARVLENGRTTASMRDLTLRAALPLSASTARGTVALAAARAGERSLDGVALDFELAEPLAWAPPQGAAPGAQGTPRATLEGKVERFDAGAGKGALEALRLVAERPAPDQYRLEGDATLAALSARGQTLPGKLSAELDAQAALGAGTLELQTALRGERDAAVDLGLDARFERESERLRYEASLSAQKLEAFADFLAGLAPEAGDLRLDGARVSALASGDLTGLLVRGDGDLPELAENPLGRLRGAQKVQLDLAGIDYRAADRTLAIPELAFELGSEHGEGGKGQVRSSLGIGSLDFAGAGTALRLQGLRHALEGRFDRSPDRGTVDLRSTLELDSATQNLLPAYPVADVRLSSHVQVDRLRSISLRELELENPAAGSVLEAAGALELTPTSAPGSETITGRQAVALEGRFEQRLAPLEALGFAARSRGSISLPFRVESGGLLAYRLLATLEARDVSFANPERTLVVERLNGVIPIVEEVVLLSTGPELSPGPATSPLADPRFFDVHPFLTASNYVTADSITIGGLQPLGPLAANVRLDRSDFLIDQLQVGFRGGQITGRVHMAYRQGDPIMRMRLNATGLRSSEKGEVLDANMALTFVPAALTLDGKVQLVRASRSHVMDLLDVLDPYRELATANRVRRALAFGYPKFVRFSLHDGAVDSKVELGGIAKLVRIDEIRAVPLGPILQRYVAPTLEGMFTPKATPPTDGTAPETVSAEARTEARPRATAAHTDAAHTDAAASAAPRGRAPLRRGPPRAELGAQRPEVSPP